MKKINKLLILIGIMLFTIPTIVLGLEDDNSLVPQNGIPLVIIRVDESEEANNNTIWIIIGLSTLAIASIIIFKKNK